MLAAECVGVAFDEVQLNIAHREPGSMSIKVRAADLLEANYVRIEEE